MSAHTGRIACPRCHSHTPESSLFAGGLGSPEATVVMTGTSSGLKDTGATTATLPQVPLIEPSLQALDRVLDDY